MILTISIISIILIFVGIFVYNNNKTYIYEIENVENADYYISGKVTFKGKEISIIINELGFLDKEFYSTEIKNYEYNVISNNTYLFGYGFPSNISTVEENKTIKTITEEFKINYRDETNLNRKEIVENNIYLVLNFIDKNDQKITKEIEISLLQKN